MKIVNIIGGLGNQMLQYAYAVRLKAMHPDEIVLVDTSHFRGYGIHNGYEIDRIFGQKIPIAKWWQVMRVSWYLPWYKPSRLLRRILPHRKTECIENSMRKYDNLYSEWQGDGYFEGYWHYSELQRPYMKEIREAFTFPDFKDEYNLQIAKLMISTESLSIHVRRGDYVLATNFMGICTPEYYQKAFYEAIKHCPNPEIFIFSDDIDYCEQLFAEFKGKYNIHYISHNKGLDSFRDMQLMTLAKINIVANSTFSWWGAWLNKREGHLTICPSRWMTFTDSMDMVPEDWIKIE